MTKNAPHPSLIITLTLPHSDQLQKEGTLLIARGDLAYLRQITYTAPADLLIAIEAAVETLMGVEADPPVIPDAPVPPPASARANATVASPFVPEPPGEPMVEVPLKKGVKRIKRSHLTFMGGEEPVDQDTDVYRNGLPLAGRLIDGKLWDGEVPIRIPDVDALAKKLKHVDDKAMCLFTLEDFVQVGTGELTSPEADESRVVTPV